MEWLKILTLCLSCFSLGISLTGLIFVSLSYKRTSRWLKAQNDKKEPKP